MKGGTKETKSYEDGKEKEKNDERTVKQSE